MNCERFDRWLDAGMPAAEASPARRHALDCGRCAAALEAMLELEAALTAAPGAPEGFTDRVMARVALTPQRPLGAAAAPMLVPALPWWVRAARDPAMLLAAVLAAAMIGWGERLLSAVRLAEVSMAHSLTGGSLASWSALAADPRFGLALMLAVTPTLWWAGRRLYAWSETLVSSRSAARLFRAF